jgi:hypothetical protein
MPSQAKTVMTKKLGLLQNAGFYFSRLERDFPGSGDRSEQPRHRQKSDPG